MLQLTRLPARACLLTAFLTFAPVVFAGIVEPGPLVLPANVAFTVQDTCISVVCLENTILSGFDVTSDVISGGNEVTMSNVTMTANLFQNVLGSPGAFIAPVQLSGEADITYDNKTTLSEFGTFSAVITSLNLTGTFVGPGGSHTLSVMLNPADPSTGSTTVEPLGTAPPTFQITSFFDVFTELSVDGGGFVPGPERTADITTTPEPALYGVLGLVLAAMAARRNRSARV